MAHSTKEGIFNPMAKKYPKPILKPRELKKVFEDQWYVEAEWPNGTIDEVAGPFASESKARDWITDKSQAWLEAKGA